MVNLSVANNERCEPRWAWIAADIFLGSAVIVAWAGLMDRYALSWQWVGPSSLIVVWAALRSLLKRRRLGRLVELIWGLGCVLVGAVLPA